jgi:dipeptidyl aminopeptidase/acylaminoacyl peptidase
MRSLLWAAGLFAATFFSIHVRADPPPAEAFGSLPEAEIGRLSPDGKRLAIIRPYDGHQKVAIYDLTKANAAPYVVGMDGGLASDLYWKGNDLLICLFHANLGRGRRDVSAWSRAISVIPSTQTAVLLMYNVPYFTANHDAGTITDADVDDPDHVYMTAFNRWDRKVTLDLYKVDVKSGAAELALHGNTDVFRFLTDSHGNVLGQLEQDSQLTDHLIVANKEVLKFDVRGKSGLQIEGLTAGPHLAFALRKQTPSHTTGLYAWSADAVTPLFENASLDVGNAIIDERSWRVIGATYTDDQLRVKYFDPAMQHVQELLEKAYPGQSVLILSEDAVRDSYLILTEGPRNPPVMSLYTVANHQVNIVQESYPALKRSDLGEVKPYPYKARDGLDIHAYLTLPPGKTPRNLPTVIFPHGGPETRDSMDFDWWAQFMASRGYAVLQPNYRGSAGYGWPFIEAGDGEWAGKVQDDLEDGVQKLIADGIADPKRICIIGASWGGYLALMGASFKPDLYACAISYAGVSDLNHDLYTGTSFESEAVSIWKRRLGADKDSGKLDSQSPKNFADRVRIPVLLIHGDHDTTVRIDQSQIEERALRHADKEVEFVTLEGDDHSLEFAETRTRMLKEVERFLGAHIGNDASLSKETSGAPAH